MLQPDVSDNIESSNSNRTAAEPPNSSISGSTTPIELIEICDVEIMESVAHHAHIISSSLFGDESQGSHDNEWERDTDESESGTDSSTNTVSLESQMDATTLQDDDYTAPVNAAIATGWLLYSTKYIITNTSL